MSQFHCRVFNWGYFSGGHFSGGHFSWGYFSGGHFIGDISVEDISAEDISAEDISAEDISAEGISVEDDIKCPTLKYPLLKFILWEYPLYTVKNQGQAYITSIKWYLHICIRRRWWSPFWFSKSCPVTTHHCFTSTSPILPQNLSWKKSKNGYVSGDWFQIIDTSQKRC